MAQMIVDLSGRTPTDAAVRTAVSVYAAYLEAAFAEIEAAHGGLDAYLENELGVDARLRAAVEDRLLV